MTTTNAQTKSNARTNKTKTDMPPRKSRPSRRVAALILLALALLIASLVAWWVAAFLA